LKTEIGGKCPGKNCEKALKSIGKNLKWSGPRNN